MKPHCGRSIVQVLVIRVDVEVVIYEDMTSLVCEVHVGVSGPSFQSIYKRGDLRGYVSPVGEVSGSGPGCKSGYRSGDL